MLSALLLGLVQGLTEFLPISSSGHLVLASELLDYQSPGLLLETVVHLATTLVIVIYFRHRFVATIKGIVHEHSARRLALMVGLAFGVTSAIGLTLSPWIKSSFESPVFAGGMLLVTGLALVSAWRFRADDDTGSVLNVTWQVALLVGAAQGLAIFPGISRSGFTIVAGIWGGMGRSAAAEFSFLLAVPTLVAASLFSLLEEPVVSGADAGALLVAGAAAFLSGLVAVHWLMRWLRRGKLAWFAVYCGLLGGAAVASWGLGVFGV